MLNTLYALSHLRFIITCDASSTFIPNLKIRKLKHREMKWFAKGHRADGWVSTDSKRIEFRNCPLNHYNGSKHHSFLSQGLHTCYSSCLEQFPLDCPMDPSSSSFSVYAELLQSCLTLCNPLDLPGPLYMGFPRQEYWSGKVVLRWQKNRTGIPLSPQQIHHKNIWTLSKFHKTTFECWQRTSDTQKSSPLSSKVGRKKYKRKKERQKR